MTILVVIPAFNEHGKIQETIRDLKKNGYKNMVVVDDGSSDQTGKLAKKENVEVLTHIVNRGLGAALGTGFEYAKENEPDILVTFDADGQMQAKDIKALVKPIEEKKADVVIGSRALDQKNMPPVRIVLNWISNFATLILYGVWTTDSLSGFRSFDKDAYNKIQIKTDRMEVSNEFFKEIKRNNLKFVEIPIKAIYTDYSKKNSKNSDPFDIGFKLLLRLFR